ncbi:M42 family metallopeptidase [Fictibacillus sp. BK138]|jgi:putative aminopeptidase FrvX|uniref:M42 family metallopeptidase n=1 Tax=Fictibacillus sp. BK138 TaxID=2512121 RepID=UPI00102A66BD|nr:M42 family metallopeptidase [Fictibacillus sp. BK138]RZT22006.1 putative aminopeptidase FrvX [Fictibacillus sp. BK138]
MNKETLALFKTLTEMPAAPGFERDLRKFVRQEIEPFSDEIIQDGLGSIFGVKKGNGGPKIMVAGHMDEVGFMVTKITKNGMLKFQELGGWWSQVLLAQRVNIYTDSGEVITGIIGSTPPHLLSEDQRNRPMGIKNMYIDIGADDDKDAFNMGVRPGQQIVPICPFTPMTNPKKIMAKAWDNRYGVGLAIELLKELKDETLPNELYSGATVQEEVGLRGSKTAANLIQPDLFFALDASPANDMMGDKSEFGQLGKGALLRILDRTMVTHRGMKEFILDTAETNNIPYQYFISQGGTDAGSVHVSGNGVPSAVIGICSRYIHTHASIIHIDDYAAAKELLVKLIKTADASTLQTILENS